MDIVRWDDPADLEVPFEGAKRRELAANDELMLVHNTVTEGREYPPHTHDHVTQGVYVITGAIQVFGDRTVTLNEGDSVVIPPGVHHGFRGAAPESEMLVSFTPPVDVSPSDLEE